MMAKRRGERSFNEEQISMSEIHLERSAASISAEEETDAERNKSLKLTYKKKVYVFPLVPGKKVEELVEEIKAKTGSNECEILNLGGGCASDDDEVLTMELPFQVVLGPRMTVVEDARDLDVPLRQAWIEEENKKEIIAYLEKKLNEGHLIKKQKYLFHILQDKMKECGGNLDDTLSEVLSGAYTPQQTLQMVMKLLHMGAKASGKKTGNEDVDKMSIPLHLSIKRDGYEDVALALLSWGALIDERNEKGETVLEIAYRDQRDELMAWIIQHMHPKMVRATFSYTFNQNGCSSNEQISLRSMIKKSEDTEGKKRRPMKKSVMAVLDSLWEETKEGAIAYYFPLECDTEGRGPDEKGFDLKGGKSCLQKLALAEDPDYVQHKVVRLLIDRKWRLYGRTYYILSAILYFIANACLTTALALALDTEDPMVYGSSRTEELRITCEVVVFLWILMTVILEALEFKSGKLRYIKNPLNYLDLGSVLFLVATIITRIGGSRTQWWFFSGGYFLTVLRMAKFFPLYRHLRAYLITFRRTIWDFLSFFILFALFNFAFTGAFSAALRYDGQLSSKKNARTSNYGSIFFSFAQILVDNEPAIPFYENDNFVYGVYPTILLLVSLFVSLVMLMNLLIAQLSDTYQKTRTNAKLEVLSNRAEMVAKVESFRPQIQRFFYKDMKELSHKDIRDLKLTRNYQKTTEENLDEMHHKIYELEHHLLKVKSMLEERQAANDAV